ncbi:MAG: saccharopine dehydrogenase [Gammaproteobacteria bacterium]|nr:saccharopine dehydrogenase NADP-binding domain-containing protein [Gammaproteobacteria bacterium]NND37055.1 saccharopine dehydrogenase [Gammaproteobacteria bacterium]
MADPNFDVVVFGATSFVGRILCRYLADRFGVDGELRWAAAARSRDRLESVRASLGDTAAGLELIVADAADAAALITMCERARVVVSTVGPYALYGEPLIRACVETGTDYCDLTAEFQWMRRMITTYHSAARESGARLVHCCGFDSIPSDLGVFFLQQRAQERFGKPCAHIRMRVKAMRGGFSGGTVASITQVIEDLTDDPELRRRLASPYCLCPQGHGFTARQRKTRTVAYDPDFDRWTAPFLMEPINTRIVHRSNALSQNAYGDAFRYDEAVLTGDGVKGRLMALGLAGALAGFGIAASFGPTRRALGNFVPAPGTGPSEQDRARGFFDLRFVGEMAAGDKIFAKVIGDMDPGYGSTAKMLGEAGACLALDLDDSGRPGGFWTPATMFGERLIDRLETHAGVKFELLDDAGNLR